VAQCAKKFEVETTQKFHDSTVFLSFIYLYCSNNALIAFLISKNLLIETLRKYLNFNKSMWRYDLINKKHNRMIQSSLIKNRYTYVAPMRFNSCAKALFSSARDFGPEGIGSLALLLSLQIEIVFSYLLHVLSMSYLNWHVV